MSDTAIYVKLIAMSIYSQLQYRASFVMMSLGLALVTIIEFFSIWVLFERFGGLHDWSLAEVGIFYGIIHSSFAVAEGVGRGFDIFHRYIVLGEFDRILLLPRSTVCQVLGQDLQLMRIGRLLQAVVVMAWACIALELTWTPLRIGVLLASLVAGVMFFTALFIIQATFSFWSVRSLEFMNAFTNGGTVMAQWPFSIYRGWFRKFFIYVIPVACISYFPALFIMGRQDPLGSTPLLQVLSPLAGLVFLAAALKFWHFGVTRYQSTGS